MLSPLLPPTKEELMAHAHTIHTLTRTLLQICAEADVPADLGDALVDAAGKVIRELHKRADEAPKP